MILAHYFDGLSARLHLVHLDVAGGAINLAGPDLVRSYAFAETILAEPFAGAVGVLDFADGARCEIADPACTAAIAAALGYRKSRVVRWQERWYGALLALIFLAATLSATVKWGIPALTDRIVAALPDSVDRNVGEAAFEAAYDQWFDESRLSDQRIAEVQAMFSAVAPSRPRLPMQLHVLQADTLPPNALAFPDGQIVVTDSMILHILGGQDAFDDQARAMLTGVLAHEVAHVQGRHSMRTLARSSLVAALSATLFGDFSTVIAGAPVLLLNMDYSRGMELEADAYATARMTQLGLPQAALADLFVSLEALAPGQSVLPRWMQQAGNYFSSHPATDERTKIIRRGPAE